ncbi:Double zinc ribbon [Butyrivibrio sp. ob235]|uniref:zinc ribbon domain-containing protein n=1 Tax=Butyrivibrio sp. ob235 TaxID=1761780 RepID=UPI0008C62546|nr:zinc ribbon domain-containing protein [Butyrivibrio sp. ob235]SEM59304.1 Double zinc ribbon [Butyrivibrio sp. ob235]
MALINCPGCGKEVSDQSSACPSCGFPINNTVRCPECGRILPQGTSTCPDCGYPINETSKKRNGSNTKKFLIIGIPLLLIAIIGVAFIVKNNFFNDPIIGKWKATYITDGGTNTISIAEASESFGESANIEITFKEDGFTAKYGDYLNDSGTWFLDSEGDGKKKYYVSGKESFYVEISDDDKDTMKLNLSEYSYYDMIFILERVKR